MEGIKIVHISDIHISEHLTKGADKQYKAPHRYGHDVSAFLALDNILKSTDWDLLVITGDITRIGNSQSFEYVRNWLESELHIGAHCIGLNLSKHEDREYVIVPGNHDRFNGGLTQGSLDNYHQEFPVVKSGSTKSFYFRGERINVHFYDSTEDNGSFAYGRIDEADLVPKIDNPDLNIAMLHHHFIQPPKHKRETATELVNSADVSAYFINSGFNGVFFGHTHQGFIDNLSVDVLAGVLPDKKRLNRLIRRLVPKYFLRKIDDDCLVSYRRESARNGQLPTLKSYFEYLYLSKKNKGLKGPDKFEKISEFYKQLDEVTKETSIEKELDAMYKKEMLVSLAPSACQAEAKWVGFHDVTFRKTSSGKYKASWNRYQYNGAKFQKKTEDEHLS
jgi:predicted phosphodiesterase